jgi:hypothetical protein
MRQCCKVTVNNSLIQPRGLSAASGEDAGPLIGQITCTDAGRTRERAAGRFSGWPRHLRPNEACPTDALAQIRGKSVVVSGRICRDLVLARSQQLRRVPHDRLPSMLEYGERLVAGFTAQPGGSSGHDENPPKLTRIPAFTRLLVLVKS